METPGTAGLEAAVSRMAVRKMKNDLIKTFDSVNPSGSAAGFPVVIIAIGGVTSFDQYAEIHRALQNDVRGVRSVTVVKLSPGEVVILNSALQ